MNLGMHWPQKETEDSLFSINRNCETPIPQSHTKPEEILQFKLTQPKETISFNTSFVLGLD